MFLNLKNINFNLRILYKNLELPRELSSEPLGTIGNEILLISFLVSMPKMSFGIFPFQAFSHFTEESRSWAEQSGWTERPRLQARTGGSRTCCSTRKRIRQERKVPTSQSYRKFHRFEQAKFPDGDLIFKPIFNSAQAGSKNNARFKSGQNRLKNNHLAFLSNSETHSV